MLRRVPMIVILGSTGTGKTKLSLELSERFGGEIISADSMQVYANLDIVTAKATKEEQSRAKHHMLDVAAPNETFTVVNFRNKALPIVENLLAESKCPIVVGGTNYYIESLLWNVLVSSPDCADYLPSTSTLCAATERTTNADVDATAFRNAENLSFLPSEELILQSSELLHKHLRNIDPTTANRIHPNNKRKIMRAIEFYQQTGQLLSSMLNEQRQQPGANRLGGPLRYTHTILLWLRCNQDVLNERLDKRVDSMLEQGLLRELRAFYNDHTHNKTVSEASHTTSPKSELAYDKGVLQTIGFKEFIPYLNRFDEAEDQKIDTYLRENGYKMPSEEEFKSPSDEIPPGMELLSSCLNELKLVTRRYSKKQIKWINNRFLASKDRQVPDLYELDTSDVANWHAKVYCKAEKIIDCYRNNKVCEIKPMQKTVHPAEGLNEETTNFCSTCERYFIGEYQWGLHLKSSKHKKRKEAIKRNARKQTLNEIEYQSEETH